MTKSNVVEGSGSHRHFCGAVGHSYECWEDCECICGQPMTGNDHTDCPVEIRDCPEHEFVEQEPLAEGLPEGVVEIKFPPDLRHLASPHCECGCADTDISEIVGWCLYCDHVFSKYTLAIQSQHFARHCPDAPPVLQEAAKKRLRQCAVGR